MTDYEMYELIRGFGYTTSDQTDELVEAIFARLAQPEPEPVAWYEVENYLDDDNLWCERKVLLHYDNGCATPLYAAPPQREWVGLTKEEMQGAWRSAEFRGNGGQVDWFCEGAHWAEAKLKEKNGA